MHIERHSNVFVKWYTTTTNLQWEENFQPTMCEQIAPIDLDFILLFSLPTQHGNVTEYATASGSVLTCTLSTLRWMMASLSSSLDFSVDSCSLPIRFTLPLFWGFPALLQSQIPSRVLDANATTRHNLHTGHHHNHKLFRDVLTIMAAILTPQCLRAAPITHMTANCWFM